MHVKTSRLVVSMLIVGFLLGPGALNASDLQGREDAPSDLPKGPLRLGPEMPGSRDAVEIPEHLREKLSTTDFIDYCVASNMSSLNAPGAAVAIYWDGELFYEQGYGVKHRSNGGEVTPETYFRIGSITKQFTAAAVMQQVDQGAVDLDDALSLYVPELALAGWWTADDIRIRHLLSHTAAYPDNLVDIEGDNTDEALSNWVATQSETRLHAPPGVFWNYSNPNFMLAGLVAERASGVPYREYMETRVFDAAGLERSTFDPAVVMADGDYSFGHYETDGEEFIYAPDSYENAAAAPAGWAFSTAGDLARWADLLMSGGGDFLSETAVGRMQGREAWTDYRVFDYYGLGIFNEQYRGLSIRQHGGNIPGWGSYLLWVPRERFAVAVLGNTFESLTGAAYCIVNTTLLPSGGTAQVASDPERWPRFEGAYDGYDMLGTPLDMAVYLVGNHLMLDLLPVEPDDDVYTTEMLPIYGDVFAVDVTGDGGLDIDLTFITTDGNPWRAGWLRTRTWVGERSVPARGGGGGQVLP